MSEKGPVEQERTEHQQFDIVSDLVCVLFAVLWKRDFAKVHVKDVLEVFVNHYTQIKRPFCGMSEFDHWKDQTLIQIWETLLLKHNPRLFFLAIPLLFPNLVQIWIVKERIFWSYENPSRKDVKVSYFSHLFLTTP